MKDIIIEDSTYFIGRPPRYPITRRSAVRERIPAVPCGLIIIRPAISEAVPDTSVEVLRGNDAGHAAASARRRYLSGRTGSVGCGCCGCCGERGSDHCHNGQCGFHWFPPKCQQATTYAWLEMKTTEAAPNRDLAFIFFCSYPVNT